MDGRKKQSKDYTVELWKAKEVLKHTWANLYNLAKQLKTLKNSLLCKDSFQESVKNHTDPNSDLNGVPDQNSIPEQDTILTRNHDYYWDQDWKEKHGKKSFSQVLLSLIYISLHCRHSFWQKETGKTAD